MPEPPFDRRTASTAHHETPRRPVATDPRRGAGNQRSGHATATETVVNSVVHHDIRCVPCPPTGRAPSHRPHRLRRVAPASPVTHVPCGPRVAARSPPRSRHSGQPCSARADDRSPPARCAGNLNVLPEQPDLPLAEFVVISARVAVVAMLPRGCAVVIQRSQDHRVRKGDKPRTRPFTVILVAPPSVGVARRRGDGPGAR
jgi:hypothetical protein